MNSSSRSSYSFPRTRWCFSPMYKGSLSSSWNRRHPFAQSSWVSGKDQGEEGRRELEVACGPRLASCHLWKGLEAKPLTEVGLLGGSNFRNQGCFDTENPLRHSLPNPGCRRSGFILRFFNSGAIDIWAWNSWMGGLNCILQNI